MMKDLPIIALDFESKEKVNQFLDLFDESLFVKVGMELFYQEGPQLINEIKERGHDVFLDLKLHDIPNTVGKAMEGLAKLNVDLVNGASFLKVTPGIRPKGASQDDQHRITTPEEARQLGSTHIVVGRPITQSDNPVESYHKIKESWLV